MAKGEIAHDEKFLNLPHGFKLSSIIIFSFLHRCFSNSWVYVFEVSCRRFVVCGKGLTYLYDKARSVSLHIEVCVLNVLDVKYMSRYESTCIVRKSAGVLNNGHVYRQTATN